MKSAVVVFPGINREYDMMRALAKVAGTKPVAVWHGESELPKVDFVVVPGGFSYGDYLRCGAIAARSPIVNDLVKKAALGLKVLGVCNGFQILTEAGLLPGVLMRNAGLKFVCREVKLRVENNRTFFTNKVREGDIVRCPIAHGEGNYVADSETVTRLEGDGRVAFRYVGPDGKLDPRWNINGATNAIAGILSERGNVLGLMPHPENHVEAAIGPTDGRGLFAGLTQHFAKVA